MGEMLPIRPDLSVIPENTPSEPEIHPNTVDFLRQVFGSGNPDQTQLSAASSLALAENLIDAYLEGYLSHMYIRKRRDIAELRVQMARDYVNGMSLEEISAANPEYSANLAHVLIGTIPDWLRRAHSDKRIDLNREFEQSQRSPFIARPRQLVSTETRPAPRHSRIKGHLALVADPPEEISPQPADPQLGSYQHEPPRKELFKSNDSGEAAELNKDLMPYLAESVLYINAGAASEHRIPQVTKTEPKERVKGIPRHRQTLSDKALVVPTALLTESAFSYNAEELDEKIEDLQPELADTTNPLALYLKEISETPLLNAEQEVELSKDIEAGLYAEELLRQHEAGEIAVEQPYQGYLRDLRIVARRGTIAKDHMIKANLRLVVSVARRYRGFGLPFLDVIQEGNAGLIRAVEKFDFTQGYKFSTYAWWWIQRYAREAVAKQVPTINLPRKVREEVARFKNTQSSLREALGKEPTDEEIASTMETTLDGLQELRERMRAPASLDKPLGDDRRPLVEFMRDSSTNVERTALSKLNLEEMLAIVDRRTADFIRLTVIGDFTNDEAGKRYNVSRETVRKSVQSGLATIRAKLREDENG